MAEYTTSTNTDNSKDCNSKLFEIKPNFSQKKSLTKIGIKMLIINYYKIVK